MTGLPDPIRSALEDELDEAAVARLWRGTRQRMEGRRRPSRARPLATALALSLAAGALWLVWPGGSQPGPLRLASGEAFAAVRTTIQSRRVDLDEASSIELGPRSSLEVHANDAGLFATELSTGRARISVTPGTGRRWVIDCGIARVEVIGTVFILDHRGEGLWVEVERGQVRVRAAERVYELGAGEHVLVARPAGGGLVETPPQLERVERVEHGAEPVQPAAPVPRVEHGAEPTPAEPSTNARPRAARREAEPWRVLAERGAHAEAYRALGPRGIDARVTAASARELMMMADVARLSGHPADAVRPLERLLAEHPRDAEAPLAAVILGRLEMDALRRPSRAVAALERAVALGVPAALADDVSGRLALARLASGDRARGEASAAAYLAERPDGRHARRLRELLGR